MKNEEARVHFIPDLKDRVFVTLCAPVVINDEKEEKPMIGRNSRDRCRHYKSKHS